MRLLDRGRSAVVIGAGAALGILAFAVLGDLPAGPSSTPNPAASSVAGAGSTEASDSAISTLVSSPQRASRSNVPSTSADADAPGQIHAGPAVIHAVGDVVFDPTYIDAFDTKGYAFAFERLGGLFISDALTIANLECAPSTLGIALDKDFAFRCPPSSLTVAKSYGIDAVNLGNNHSQDFGKQALLDGLLQTRLAGLAPVGAGVDGASANAPALFDIGQLRVAVLGMGGVVPGSEWLASPDRAGMASGDDVGQMTDAIRAADELSDLVFVTIHWGVEGESEPREDDRERARQMIAAGADAIFGHHPHRLGSLEFVDGVPVFWTLGNFIWPRLSDVSATSGVARLEIASDGSIAACLLPAFIEVGGQPVLTGATTCGSAP